MRDKIHDAVCTALEKEGWIIVSDPFKLRVEHTTLKIDLEAEKVIAFQRGTRSILVEIKSLDYGALLYSSYAAYGQYEFYRNALEEQGIDKDIYLATSEVAHQKMQLIPALVRWLDKHEVNLLIVNIEHEEIVQWIDYNK